MVNAFQLYTFVGSGPMCLASAMHIHVVISFCMHCHLSQMHLHLESCSDGGHAQLVGIASCIQRLALMMVMPSLSNLPEAKCKLAAHLLSTGAFKYVNRAYKSVEVTEPSVLFYGGHGCTCQEGQLLQLRNRANPEQKSRLLLFAVNSTCGHQLFPIAIVPAAALQKT